MGLCSSEDSLIGPNSKPSVLMAIMVLILPPGDEQKGLSAEFSRRTPSNLLPVLVINHQECLGNGVVECNKLLCTSMQLLGGIKIITLKNRLIC